MKINVMAAGSTQPGLDFVAAAFGKETGHQVDITYNRPLEVFDVLVSTSDSLEKKYRPKGLVGQDAVCIGRMGMGVAVRSGAPKPDVASLESLKRAVLEADALLLTTHASGVYIEDEFKKMNWHEQVAGKILRFDSAPALMDRLASGKTRELSILSTNQIRSYRDKGLALAGPLPVEIQDYRDFMAAPAAQSPVREAAEAFVRYCGGPGRAILAEHGFD